ncbi:MAG TPA: acetylxylan esterase [Bryobacteraceae bacterium]|nr:acetylxylan esterase [Bryobacteraceae bacterium]
MRRTLFSRRTLLQAGSGALTVDVAAAAQTADQATGSPASPKSEPPALNRFPRMVQEYYVRRLRDIPRPVLNSKADAEAYVSGVRAKARECFGPMPEKTPLNARITGTLERDAYRIENVIFESRPGFLVTANLYLPKRPKGPLPAVIGSCGHSNEGKAGDTYQAFSQGLARLGYAVLIFDPIGQGERLQYVTPELKPRIGIGVAEHIYAGNQQLLNGEFFGAWRAWDGIRALDYLLTRPEVDPRRVGVTGNSGGGTMTTWLCALDDRWAMAAAGCFVTMFRRNLENELPADAEQCPPRALALSLEHEDFIAAMAPRPVILLAKDGDFFDVRGSREAYGRLKHLYTLLGAPENIELNVAHGEHGYTQDSREAMYRFFGRATGSAQPAEEPKLNIEKPETLLCTPKGQVADLGSRTIFSFTRDRAVDLQSRRPAGSLEERLTSVLRLPKRSGAPDFRILRPAEGRGYPKKHFSTYAVETEPGIQSVVYRLSDTPLYSQPPEGPERAILYVSHHSADRELRNEPLVRDLIAADPTAAFYTCDVRGIGESRPDTCGPDSFLKPYGSDYFYAMHGVMMDEPYVGRKAHDILSVLDWLASFDHTKVHLAAFGWGSVPAAFAAVLSPHVAQVTLKRGLESFAAIGQSEMYTWPVSTFVQGAVGQADLPECYHALRSKNLRMI